ncbi:uncharacterized protein [Ptychodera flava]|uniref:uncharacterized protein n=1 Tax=Ptychodera flava TaxID=63121 RepID=UPI003969DA0E
MVNRCPNNGHIETLDQKTARHHCEETKPADMTSARVDLKTPVYGSKRLFRNVYCALCNGIALEDLEFFNTTITCNHPFAPTGDTISDILLWLEKKGDFCRVTNSHPTDQSELVHKCVKLENPCEGNPYMHKMCESFLAATSVLWRKFYSSLRSFVHFRNPFCLFCVGHTRNYLFSYTTDVSCGVRQKAIISLTNDSTPDSVFELKLSFGYKSGIVLEIFDKAHNTSAILTEKPECAKGTFVRDYAFMFLCIVPINDQAINSESLMYDAFRKGNSTCGSVDSMFHPVNLTLKVVIDDTFDENMNIFPWVIANVNQYFERLINSVPCYRLLDVKFMPVQKGTGRYGTEIIVRYALSSITFDVIELLVSNSSASDWFSPLNVVMIIVKQETHFGDCEQPGNTLSFSSSSQFQLVDVNNEVVTVIDTIRRMVYFVTDIVSSADLAVLPVDSVDNIIYKLDTCAKAEPRNIIDEAPRNILDKGIDDSTTQIPVAGSYSDTPTPVAGLSTPVSHLPLSCPSGKIIRIPDESVIISDGLLRAEGVTNSEILAFKIVPLEDVALVCVSINADANAAAVIANLRRFMVAFLRYTSAFFIFVSTFIVCVLLVMKNKLEKICLSFLIGFGLLSEVIGLVIEENTLSHLPCMVGSIVKHFSNISSCAWLLSFSLSLYVGEKLGENQSLSYKDKIISVAWGSIFPVSIAVLELALHYCGCTQLVVLVYGSYGCSLIGGISRLIFIHIPCCLSLVLSLPVIITVYRRQHRRESSKYVCRLLITIYIVLCTLSSVAVAREFLVSTKMVLACDSILAIKGILLFLCIMPCSRKPDPESRFRRYHWRNSTVRGPSTISSTVT